MSSFKNSKFFRVISSLLGQAEPHDTEYTGINKNEYTSCEKNDNNSTRSRIWKRDYNPLRQIILWGWDENNNPGFLMLNGKHQFKSRMSTGNILEDEVKYTSYAVFKGNGGHLPSFKAVKIIEPYDYRSRSYTAPKMYFKKAAARGWYWRDNSEYLVKSFNNLPTEQQVSFPFFNDQSYGQYVQEIMNRSLNFKLARNPNEVLKLDGQLLQYYEKLVDIMSHTNVYIRKKRLNELIEMCPQKEVYILILQMGSTEVISGLFLELAKTANPVLEIEAKAMLESDLKWADENYAEGVKRCMRIYLNTLNKDSKAERSEWIRKYLSQMDLKLIRINGKDIPKDKILSGAAYRKYANTGLLQDYFWNYDYKTRQSSKHEAPKRYEAGLYTDGVKLRIIDFKNTIQEAEAYGLADVIGKIAYYVDAPRITYYLKGSGKGGALRYFRRYIKRVIDSYAEKDLDKFIEAMKYLLTSYTEYDYVCKFRDNFQFNELLKYYLYYDFKEKPPVGWENWAARHEWMSNDQLLRLEGRYEFMKEIWDNHLESVMEIALGAKIEQVVKACYFILKDSPKSAEFIEGLSYQRLINLALSSYKPLSEMFMEILTSRLQRAESFDSELMICLIGSGDERMYGIAMEFFKRTNGRFSPADTADLLFLDNIQQWGELFRQNLLSMSGNQFMEFVGQVLGRSSELLKLKKDLPESIGDILTESINITEQFSEANRAKITEQLIAVVTEGTKLPQWLGRFVEELIFSYSYDSLEALLSNVVIQQTNGWTVSRNKRIISVLEGIKNRNIPTDAQILDILDSGTSNMIRILFRIINENSEELNNRFSTLLIMLESDIPVLNEMAEGIFNSMATEKQKKLHALIIDSPVTKAYIFGLKKLDTMYGDAIPEEFIIQMLEHSSTEVKTYISDKTDRILHSLGGGNAKIFMYYVKTLLLLPNRASKSKDKAYEAIPRFALKYTDNMEEIQNILMDIGGSNSITDSERALVALAKIRREVVAHES